MKVFILSLFFLYCHGKIIELPFKRLYREMHAFVSIGNPKQKLNIHVNFDDTEFIVTSTDCDTCQRKQQTLFDPSKSSTFEDLNGKFNFESMYGPLTGGLGKDEVYISGTNIGKTTFGLSNITNHLIEHDQRNFDGILGLKGTQSSGYNGGLQTILQAAGKNIFTITQTKTKDRLVQNGILSFGGYNEVDCKQKTNASFPLLIDEKIGHHFHPEFVVNNELIAPLITTINPSYEGHVIRADMFHWIGRALKAEYRASRYYLPCELPGITFDLEMGAEILRIPASAFITKLQNGKCILGIKQRTYNDPIDLKLSMSIFDHFCVSYHLDDKKIIFKNRY